MKTAFCHAKWYLVFVLANAAHAKDVKKAPVVVPKDPKVQLIYLDDDRTGKVAVSPRGTVLNFPVKPSKVLLGRAGSFAIEYIEEDLAITPLALTSRSNLFVYLLGRRFSFDLFVTESGYTIIKIRDSKEKELRGEFK